MSKQRQEEIELIVQARTARLSIFKPDRRELGDYYRTIFENTGAVTLILEEDMSIAMVNEECRNLLGYSREDLAGRSWTEFIPAAGVEQIQAYHQQLLADPAKAPRKYPAQLIDKQGRIRDGLFIVALIPGTTSSVTTFLDFTDHKRMDRALRAISAVNAAMIRTESEAELLQAVCQLMVEIGGYSLAWVGYLPDDPCQKLSPSAFFGRDHGYLAKLNLFLHDPLRGRGPTAIAIRSGQPVVTRNFKDASCFKPWSKDALRRGFKACIDIPLLTDRQAFGVLSIYSDEINNFDLEEQQLLLEMSNNLVYAISALRARHERNQAHLQLQVSLEIMHRLVAQSYTSLGSALDIREPYTTGHHRKVVRLAAAIAEEMGFAPDQIEGLAVAGNLHDIGQINVPSEILSKPGPLTDLEFALIKNHCLAGYEIIKEIEFPWPVAEVLLQHHERMDGSGYPRGLVGDEILLEARIMAVADVVEAMVSPRPYRPARGIATALQEIAVHGGILYDPTVVEACLKLFRDKGFRLE